MKKLMSTLLALILFGTISTAAVAAEGTENCFSGNIGGILKTALTSCNTSGADKNKTAINLIEQLKSTKSIPNSGSSCAMTNSLLDLFGSKTKEVTPNASIKSPQDFINCIISPDKCPIKTTVPAKEPLIPQESHKPQEPQTPSKPQESQDPQKPQESDGKNTALSRFEKEVVSLVNAERAKHGLSPLSANQKLSEAAKAKSQDMKDKNYFSHTSPTYGSPFDMIKSFGISYNYAGENIAKGQQTPQAVMNAWMNSEGHRKNILNPNYKQIGVGYVSAGNYWTQMFIG